MPSDRALMRDLFDGLLQKDVTPAEMRLALLICRRSILVGNHDWIGPITAKEIARELHGITSATVFAAIGKLKRRNLLEVSKAGNQGNCYRLHPSILRKATQSPRKSKRKIRL